VGSIERILVGRKHWKEIWKKLGENISQFKAEERRPGGKKKRRQ